MSEAPRPWFAGEAASAGDKRHAPATDRNRDAIADVLAAHLPTAGTVLEIASGSGEHALHFAARFPHLVWQPSDPDPAALRSIAAWTGEAALPNLRPPLHIDAASADWPVDRADAMLCINMVHISEWAATVGLFRGCAKVLRTSAPLILYGPYLEDDHVTALSNLAFDTSLRARNVEWGLRRVAEIDAVAAKHGFARVDRVEMPANNLMLVYYNGPVSNR